MRNKLNEVKEFDIISRCDTIRIAMFDEPYQYNVPVKFGEEIIRDQLVYYIHTDYEGKKNDLLAKNPNIAFEMDCNHELYYRESNMSCNFRYESVVGTGRVEIVLEEEKEKAKAEMQKMLDYVEKLDELDTSEVEPMSHIFQDENVFREDVVTNGDNKEAMLANAPKAKEGQYQVPKTIGQETGQWSWKN